MKNIIASDHSCHDLFEDEVRTRMNALSTQMGTMHTLYEGLHRKVTSMDEQQDAMFSMISDIHAYYRPQSDQPPDH